MKKILFVNPSIRDTVFGKMKTLALPPMGLGVLASRTPRKYQVTILDEMVDELDLNADADLVAVTATTVQAPRAYQIIEAFKRRGIPTVMGGIHGSVRTEEAAGYADSVVVGEADEIWPEVLQDFENGGMKKRYKASTFPKLTALPRLRRELFSSKYFIDSVQTSRGCPCNCNFCSVTEFNGRKYRFRPVEEVVEEIRSLRDNRFFISDDSIVGLGKECTDHARRLFAAMKGLNKTWGSQVCITIAEHDDLLRAAAEAGVNTFYVGFESVDSTSLKSMSKGVNLRPGIRNFKEAIRRMHGYGIGIIGGFILGSDGDTKDIFNKTIDFIHDTEIDGCQFTIMTPFPGTRLYEQIRKEDRLLYTDYPRDWAKYNAYEAVIKPKNMTIDELQEGQRKIYEATSTMGRSFFRGVKTLVNTRSPIKALTNFLWNYNNYKAIMSVNPLSA